MNSLVDALVANKLCQLSQDHINSTLYGTCDIDYDKIKYLLLLQFLSDSDCDEYNLKCLVENCP